MAKRIREKMKEFDKEMLRDMMLAVRSKLRKMWRESVFFNLSLNVFVL